MPKIIHCPVTRWPGSVVLQSPLGYPAVIAWRAALARANECLQGEQADATHANFALLPGVLACVEQWQLGGDFPKLVTAETLPASPPDDADALLTWLVNAISTVLRGEETVDPK